ncbi:hypothetical protein BIT28_04295 [Photobacterium proteolyticum]|uniref:Peptidase S1 domain-containing protein n=1 Tax=Photobacterium proteolyticum TaxID=1903952 RepID=A0A1Q9H1E1_9GAMM|nr:serine protease [Photobacterium proteolyticum]OLQ81440.1 hypothetical protein BIT28_04295 [Photobacterium proteolyticum]
MTVRHLLATVGLCLLYIGQAIASDVTGYIVGGTPVKPSDDYSWIASIRLSSNQLSHTCGGTVVNQRWVLTAAHCVVQQGDDGKFIVIPPSQLSVMVGTTSSVIEDVATLYAVSHVVVYPKYSPQVILKEVLKPDGTTLTEVISTALENDLALLRVDEPFSVNINHVALATDKDADELDVRLGLQWSEKERPENTKVSGWGSTQTNGTGVSKRLLEAKLSFVPMDECFTRLELGNEAHYIIDSPMNRTKICSLPPSVIFDSDGTSLEFGSDSCKGDSGGPLSAQNELGEWVQFGIVSGGPIGKLVCGSLVRPSFYTRIGTYYPWILSIVGTIPEKPVTKPDFITAEESATTPEGGAGGSGDDTGSGDTTSGDGKEDELDIGDCNPNSSGISHTNCNLKSASGGASIWGTILLMIYACWVRCRAGNKEG